MIITRKHVSRRALLRGMGTRDRAARARRHGAGFGAPTSRCAKVAPKPHGVCLCSKRDRHAQLDARKAMGALVQVSRRFWSRSAPLQDDILVLLRAEGSERQARWAMVPAITRGPRRVSSPACIRSKTAGSDISVGISVDQVAAQKIGNATRLASLELGCEDGHLAGNCDSGYACAYVNSISWRSATVPNPPEVNPRSVFERLFGSEENAADPAARARNAQARSKHSRSGFGRHAEPSDGKLGSTDRRKLDEYLTAMREVERQVQMADKQAAENTVRRAMHGQARWHSARLRRACATHVRPAGDRVADRHHPHLDLHAGARRQQPALSRDRRSRRHHGLSHHRNDPALMEKVAQINRYHMEQFAYFIAKLKATPGWRRHAARSQHDRLRQRHQRRQSAQSRRSSRAPGGRQPHVSHRPPREIY